MANRERGPARAKPQADAENRAEQKFMVSPRNGARCPVGAHSKNTGGKIGRSGRKPCRVKAVRRLPWAEKPAALRAIMDDPNATIDELIKAFELLYRCAYGPPR